MRSQVVRLLFRALTRPQFIRRSIGSCWITPPRAHVNSATLCSRGSTYMLISHLNINQGQQFAEIEGLARMIAVRVEDSDRGPRSNCPDERPTFQTRGESEDSPEEHPQDNGQGRRFRFCLVRSNENHGAAWPTCLSPS